MPQLKSINSNRPNMFSYNRFWHFWHTLNNRNYFNTLLTTALVTAVVSMFFFTFPTILTMSIGASLLIGGVMTFLTKLSDRLFKKQNQTLKTLKETSEDNIFKEHVDYYLNRRVVCPKELLLGKPLQSIKLKQAARVERKLVEPLLIDHHSDIRFSRIESDLNRNELFIDSNLKFFAKKAAAKDALSEIAAREMASIIGFGDVIPVNALAKNIEQMEVVRSADLLLSRHAIRTEISRLKMERTVPIKNNAGVQNAVARFILNLKTAVFRTKANRNELGKVLYIQSFIPAQFNGLTWYDAFCSIPYPDLDLPIKKIFERIDPSSFEKNFLLHLILGSQDANAGNTLLVTDPMNPKASTKLYAIDHERIMPEDNYNMTKSIPIQDIGERPFENIFPIRLWLAGLPQAERPFSRAFMAYTLMSLKPEKLLAYHQQKKLFSSAAVGAQLDRILTIRQSFSEALKNNASLTPKALFLQFVNHHPTYVFLKKQLKLSDFWVFGNLGYISEGADWSFLRHPMQAVQMEKWDNEAQARQNQDLPPFSKAFYESKAGRNLLLFNIAQQCKSLDDKTSCHQEELNRMTKSIKHENALRP